MKQTRRWLLWFVFVVQLIGFVGFVLAIALPLAQRSATDLAGLMLISAKTWEELPDERRAAFAQSLLQDTGVIIERGVLPDLAMQWRPHWYADWVHDAMVAQGEKPEAVLMQQGQVQVSIVIDSTPVLIRADSPKLGSFLVVFFVIMLLALLGTLSALWWQAKWQRQMLRSQVMLAGLSHDLRTPLTRLRLAIALLPTVTEVEQTQLSDHIRSLNALIDTALALSSSSESSAQQKQTSLPALWLQWQKDYPDVLFITEDSGCQAMLVSVLLTRIVQNLIDNALVHGLGEVRVSLSCQQAGWRIAIVDEGDGVPDQVWRAVQNQQQPKAKGVGIGLLTSYWLSQIMGVRLVRIPQGVGVSTI